MITMVDLITIKATTCFILFVLLQENLGETSENELVVKSGCICPGHLLTFECTVTGSTVGTTVWQGNFFDCSNGIILLHDNERFTVIKQDCNDGSIVAQGLTINGDRYTSQLNITMNNDINGGSIECYYNFDELTLVDSLTINKTGPFPPPSKIVISEANHEARQLNFSWSPVAPECPAVHYNILSSNCGSCPTTTNHTTVICTDVPTNRSVCTFSIQTVVYGNVTGNRSDLIKVIQREHCDRGTIRGYSGESTCIGTIISTILFGATTLCASIFSAVSMTILMRLKRVLSAKSTAKRESPDRHYEAISHHHTSTESVTIDTRKNIAYGHTKEMVVATSS